jgi:hypothetical protein
LSADPSKPECLWGWSTHSPVAWLNNDDGSHQSVKISSSAASVHHWFCNFLVLHLAFISKKKQQSAQVGSDVMVTADQIEGTNNAPYLA